MIENTLWVERFRPKTIDEYIGNDVLVNKVKKYIKNDDIPHLLFWGKSGTGKTTLAKIIANSIDCDLLYINASDENSVDMVREKVKGFAENMGFKKWKIVILDEADFLSMNAQAILRGVTEYHSDTCRFIITCNYVEKILPAIHSRFVQFEIHPPDKKTVAMRLVKIFQEDGIEYTPENLAYIINSSYPDIRKVISIAQDSIEDCQLVISKSEKIRFSYMDDIIEVLKSNDPPKRAFDKCRQILADSKVRDFQPLYRELYDVVDDICPSGTIGDVICLIGESQKWDSFAVDKEIHIATLILKIISKIKK